MKTITTQVDLESFTGFGLIFTAFPNFQPLPSYTTPDLANRLTNSGAAADGLFLCD